MLIQSLINHFIKEMLGISLLINEFHYIPQQYNYIKIKTSEKFLYLANI